MMFLRVLVLALAAAPSLAQPLSSAFTYQGELKSAGTLANGLFDMQFRLFDASSGGLPVGALLCADNVQVTSGRFTIELDFFNQFNGSMRFLEVQVRPNTGLDCTNLTGFTLLSPRQELTAAPNAVYSMLAGSAQSASNANALNGQPPTYYLNASNLNAGTLPSALLSGTYSGPLTLNNVSNTFTGSGAGLTALNATSISLGTLSVARFPFPLLLSGSAVPHAFRADNSSNNPGTSGVYATAAAADGYGDVGFATSSGGTGVYGNGANAGVRGEVNGENASGVYGLATSGTGVTYGGYFQSNGTVGTGVSGVSSPTTGAGTGVSGQCNSPNGIGVFGIATSSFGGRGLVGGSYGSSGSAYGVFGECYSTQGVGVYGTAVASTGQTYGGQFTSGSNQGLGVSGYATATSGLTTGTYGRADSTLGRGLVGFAASTTGATYGVYGQCESPQGVAVFGRSNATTGSAVGGLFWTSSPTGSAVRGEALSGGNAGYFTSPGSDAVFIQNTGSGRGMHILSTSDTAVWAESTSGIAAVHGTNSNTGGYGLLGINLGTTGNSYGVVGQTGSGTSGFGVFAFGRSGASGTKAFRIDHPADPEHKYLLHYSTESPEVLNAYSGTVRLDRDGRARVDLPSYFARINKDPRYTLTPVGSPMPMLHVAQEIDADALAKGEMAAPTDQVPVCSFRIAGGAPGAKVSWRVEAVRNDPWVRHNGAPVEADKIGPDIGTYQHPEFYGQPAERASQTASTH